MEFYRKIALGYVNTLFLFDSTNQSWYTLILT